MEKLKKQLDPASTFSKSTKTKRKPKATTKENIPSQTITREDEDPSNCCTYCWGVILTTIPTMRTRLSALSVMTGTMNPALENLAASWISSFVRSTS